MLFCVSDIHSLLTISKLEEAGAQRITSTFEKLKLWLVYFAEFYCLVFNILLPKSKGFY